MKQIFKATTTALDRIQTRFLRSRLKISRRGSVLIIVVALLVLMAIIGTAYISTARTDRGAAASNSQNTEIALLLQGVEDMASSQIIADVNPYVTTQNINGTAATINATRFRTANTAYTPYNSAINDQWLSDRVPVGLDSTVAATPGAAGNPVVWRYISLPPVNLFSDPVSGATYGGVATTPTNGSRCDYAPTAYALNGTTYPGLSYYIYSNGTGSWSPTTYLAADTDGDGIADAGLFRLPIGEINGVTYYGAYRIVDNGAAINASTAWTAQSVTPAPPTVVTSANASTQQKLPGNFWPTNVDLANLIPTTDSLANLNNFRFGAASPSTTPTEGNYGFNYYPGYSASYPSGAGNNNYDAAWHELGRRLQNPASGYAALSIGDSASMAHRFVIRDPNASLSNLEQNLPNSTTNTTYVPTTPYAATDISDWYNNNFNYGIGQQSNLSLRSLLVGLNPVSNFVQSKYGPLIVPNAANNPTGAPLPGAAWTANLSASYPNSNDTSYTFSDWVTYNNHAYVCIQPNNGQTPSTTATADTNYYSDSPYWVFEPWTNAPVKTSVNTATFGQLWLGYWNVMCDTQNNAPLPQAVGTSKTTVSSTNAMFRSSLRYSTGTPGPAVGSALSATQELQLRAAIAATNTLYLRATGTTNLTEEIAPIDDYTQTPPTALYNAVIMGNLPQPYITEVYADNDPAVGDGTNGYIGIEVYNPYPYNIQLTGWALATVARPATAGTPITPTVIPSTSTSWNTNGPIIPANGYAVFANTGNAVPTDFAAGPVATTANDSSPSASKPPLYLVSDLNQAFGNDLVLVRPPPNTASASGQPTNITGFFPVDSYDLTGLSAQKAANFNAANTYEWHYARPNSQPWQFVYPGPFDPALGSDGSKPRFKCTQASASYLTLNLNSGSPPPLNAGSLATLGQADASGTTGSYVPPPPASQTPPSFPSPAPTIQIDNIDFGGPSKLSASVTNYFPFGQFARNADIMQVPFIGSYLIYRGAIAPANLVEMNPITLDSAYAASTGGDQTVSLTGTYITQNIGRFAPYWSVDYSTTNPAGTNPYTTGGWETRLLDYLTVQAPADDYLPNTDPVQYASITGKVPIGIANSKSTIVNAVNTNPGSATEDTVPLHGLININTAPWRVLASLPFSDDPNTNAAVAQAIVNYRDGYWSTSAAAPKNSNGPFQNIFQLNNVISQFNYAQTGISSTTIPSLLFIQTLGSYNNAGIYANGYNWLAPTHQPSNNDGMLTPLYATFSANYPSATPYVPTTDFQEQNLALARVSNLITTRSDSYTVYVLVQGWANAGTAGAKLVVQRRAAFIVDRSGMTPANPTLNVTNVSTN